VITFYPKPSAMVYKKLIKLLICLGFILTALNTNAQVAILQKAIDKLDSCKNFSYRSFNKLKDLFFTDTLTQQQNAVFSKAPEDKNFGLLFKVQTLNDGGKISYADLYNGQNLIGLANADSTYQIKDVHAFDMQSTLPGNLKWLQGRLKIRSSKIIRANDTAINLINSYHLIANVYDTVINKERNYTCVDIFIDEQSGMPNCMIVRSRNSTFGNGISSYYSESSYADYKFDDNNIDIAKMTVPKGFHRLEEQPLPKGLTTLLPPGSIAPGWTLYAADGKKMSLTQMKGKVILMDFYFIGCGACMTSLNSLNHIYEKYKNQTFVLASLTERDSKKSVLAFDKNYHIKYPGYIDASDVVKSYHVTGFPTFYIIDKQGKIANVLVGYYDDFEKKMTDIIDELLKKS